MENRILWLRIAYWAGAIIDAAAVVTMLVPDLNRIFVLDGADIPMSIPYQFAMAYGAALMAGWTVLLIWADRKPIERRGVLLITAFPVVVCLNLSRVILYWSGVMEGPLPPFALVLPILLFLLFVFAYFNSRRGEEKKVVPA